MWEAEHRQAFSYEDSDDEGKEIEKIDEQDTPSELLLRDVADIGASNAPQSDTSISLAIKHCKFFLCTHFMLTEIL
jgi:hypothetical protein